MSINPSDCPIGGTYYHDSAYINPASNGWTVEQASLQDSIVSDGASWIHVQELNNNSHNNIKRQLPAIPDYVELTVGLNSVANHQSNGLDFSPTTQKYAHLTGFNNDGTSVLWSIGISLRSQRISPPEITWQIFLEVYNNSSVVYSDTLLDHELTSGELPYTHNTGPYRLVARQNGADVDCYVDGVLVYTILSKSMTQWVGVELAQYYVTPDSNQHHIASAADFRAVKLSSGLPDTCNQGCYIAFTTDKRSGTSPMYVRLDDVSYVSPLTSATDYTRIWSFTNIYTSAVEYETTTSASINKTLIGILDDVWTVSLSASI